MREAIEYKDLRTMHYFFIEEYTEKFWDMIVNSGFEYEKDELKKRAQLFIDSLNA